MANSLVRTVDFVFLDALFEMGSGYVLNFTDPTFSRFFSELGIDIDSPAYRLNGTSKAKRLRCFLSTADKGSVVRALESLWEYREAVRKRASRPESVANAQADLFALVARISGKPPSTGNLPKAKPVSIDSVILAKLQTDLLSLSNLAPQPRGYAFEAFLKSLFDSHGLEAREAFRLRGEQIDGSFLLCGETYLLEAKWQNPRCGVEDLHAFHGKVEQKATWARGLFISNSGFTEDGLHAFGRAKRVICMDGFDLYEVLERALPLESALAAKVRAAAETGLPFTRIRDLFTT